MLVLMHAQSCFAVQGLAYAMVMFVDVWLGKQGCTGWLRKLHTQHSTAAKQWPSAVYW